MKIGPIRNLQDFKQRHELLHLALRPESMPFFIEEEFPIVLNQEFPEYSYNLMNDQNIVAHANLWPRNLTGSHSSLSVTRVGLIGNVATHPKWQGRGYMKLLLKHLEAEAVSQQCSALILWSDLEEFYQKLGYESFESEYLFNFNIGSLNHVPSESKAIRFQFPSTQISTQLCEILINLRYPVPKTLQRDPLIFQKLLTIPCCDLCLMMDGDHLTAFVIIGKGYDMMGVVHEWGAKNPIQLLQCLRYICKKLEIVDIGLLSPANLEPEWDSIIKGYSEKYLALPMAFGKALQDEASINHILKGLFIWGLDSI